MRLIKGAILFIMLLSLMACGSHGDTQDDYYTKISEAGVNVQTISTGMVSIMEQITVEDGQALGVSKKRENEILLIFDKREDMIEYEYYSIEKEDGEENEIHLQNSEIGLYSYQDGNLVYETEPTELYYSSCMDMIKLPVEKESICSIVKTEGDEITYYDVIIDTTEKDINKLIYRYGVDQNQCIVYLEIIEEESLNSQGEVLNMVSKITWEVHF